MPSPLFLQDLNADSNDLFGRRAGDPLLTRMARVTTDLGIEIVDLAGFLDSVEGSCADQSHLIAAIGAAGDRIGPHNAAVRKEIGILGDETAQARDVIAQSATVMRASGESSRSVAGWVQDAAARLKRAGSNLDSVRASNTDISAIAAQVNILAINAKIEAARAGDAGRGFAVVAEAINALSQKTARAAETIGVTIEALTTELSALSKSAAKVAEQAGEVFTRSEDADRSLAQINERVAQVSAAAARIDAAADQVRGAFDQMMPLLGKVGTSVKAVATGVHTARDRVHGMIDGSETMLQDMASLGAALDDAPFIERVVADAGSIARALEQAIARGDITPEALFAQDYRQIPGTNPVQVLAPFTELADRLFPAVQEAAVGSDGRIVFCAAVDRNGYLPTHNRKFSQPQGADPVWNAANCRNRRIFNDRVGLKAGRNLDPFLVQVYRRDMGGGQFVLMKDVSAPIMVQGRHWGGLRLAYTV